jgi:hypothetical protein
MGMTAENATVAELASGTGDIVVNRGNLYVELTSSDATLYLPQWGGIIDIYATSGLDAGTISIVDTQEPNVEYARFDTVATGLTVLGTALVPRSRPVFARWTGYVATTIRTSITWRDYV